MHRGGTSVAFHATLLHGKAPSAAALGGRWNARRQFVGSFARAGTENWGQNGSCRLATNSRSMIFMGSCRKGISRPFLYISLFFSFSLSLPELLNAFNVVFRIPVALIYPPLSRVVKRACKERVSEMIVKPDGNFGRLGLRIRGVWIVYSLSRVEIYRDARNID